MTDPDVVAEFVETTGVHALVSRPARERPRRRRDPPFSDDPRPDHGGAATRRNAQAVTVGNVHGAYASPTPDLDWARLDAVRAAANAVGDVPLVLHGASGLADAVLRRAIAAGVCKFNVNTELRAAARAAHDPTADVLANAEAATEAMARVVEGKLRAFDARA